MPQSPAAMRNAGRQAGGGVVACLSTASSEHGFRWERDRDLAGRLITFSCIECDRHQCDAMRHTGAVGRGWSLAGGHGSLFALSQAFNSTKERPTGCGVQTGCKRQSGPAKAPGMDDHGMSIDTGWRQCLTNTFAQAVERWRLVAVYLKHCVGHAQGCSMLCCS